MEKELKPFDKILVRNSNKGYWIPALYGIKSKDMKHHLTSAGWQDECIPYEGNEEYLGTNRDYVCRNFPELAESEDWKIMKQIKMFIISHSRNESNNKIDSWLAWLEKQGEQKSANWLQELEDKLANATPQQLAEWKEKYFKEEPAEWSEEDEKMLEQCCVAITDSYFNKIAKGQILIDWLKSLKDRVQPKTKSTWSEEDEKKRICLIKGLEDRMGFGWVSDPFSREELITWLKSLRPQSQWKPSKEQLTALSILLKYGKSDDMEALVSLYEQLKAL